MPVKRGSTIQLRVTGLGQTLPPILSRALGVEGQSVIAALTAGVNDQGARIVRAEYVPGQVGVYLVEIEIASDTPVGSYQPVVIAVTVGADIVYSQTAYLIIE